MAIIINTKTPKTIVESIRKMIDDGKIDTWSYDDDGDFTHTGQWRNKAWISPYYLDDTLTFFIVGRKGVQMELIGHKPCRRRRLLTKQTKVRN